MNPARPTMPGESPSLSSMKRRMRLTLTWVFRRLAAMFGGWCKTGTTGSPLPFTLAARESGRLWAVNSTMQSGCLEWIAQKPFREA